VYTARTFVSEAFSQTRLSARDLPARWTQGQREVYRSV